MHQYQETGAELRFVRIKMTPSSNLGDVVPGGLGLSSGGSRPLFLSETFVPGIGLIGESRLVVGSMSSPVEVDSSLVSTPPTQDDEKKIRDAAERLDAEDIAERDAAQEELNRLGLQFPALVRAILREIYGGKSGEAATRADEILGGYLGPLKGLDVKELEDRVWFPPLPPVWPGGWMDVEITLRRLQAVASDWIKSLKAAKAAGLGPADDIDWIIRLLENVLAGARPGNQELALIRKYFELLFKEMRERAAVIVTGGKEGLILLRKRTAEELWRIRRALIQIWWPGIQGAPWPPFAAVPGIGPARAATVVEATIQTAPLADLALIETIQKETEMPLPGKEPLPELGPRRTTAPLSGVAPGSLSSFVRKVPPMPSA